MLLNYKDTIQIYSLVQRQLNTGSLQRSRGLAALWFLVCTVIPKMVLLLDTRIIVQIICCVVLQLMVQIVPHVCNGFLSVYVKMPIAAFGYSKHSQFVLVISLGTWLSAQGQRKACQDQEGWFILHSSRSMFRLIQPLRNTNIRTYQQLPNLMIRVKPREITSHLGSVQIAFQVYLAYAKHL